MASNATNNAVYGLVLAGGQSRRMGRDKALLAHGAESQLAYVVHLLEGLVDRVFISARDDQKHETERARFELILDQYQDVGPVAGILSAMDRYPDVDWLILACDLPNVDSRTVSRLLEERSAEKPFSAYRSSHDGLPEPLCAVYTSASAAIVRAFVAEGIHCPRKILIRSDTLLLEQSDPRSLDNVNTLDDLQDSVLEALS